MRLPRSALALALMLPACTHPDAPPAAKTGAAAPGMTAAPGSAATSVYAFSAVPFQGTEPKSLKAYEGQVLLIANIAANCGFTPQMGPLGELETKYKDRRFHVLGFLSDDFGQQGGTVSEVKACSLQYHASFDEFAHIHVKKGPEQHPLFAFLTSRPGKEEDVSWNFNKWIIDRKGQVVARYPSEVSPEAPELIAVLERELAAP